jgi:adenylate cyclase
MRITQQHRHIHALIIAALVAVLTFALSQTTLLQRIELISVDWRAQYFDSESHLPDSIAVVLVDDASLQYMDPLVGRWPWPRSVLADLVDFISLGEPKAIIFDILFPERQISNDGHDHDQRLIASTRAAGNIIHAMQLIEDEADEGGADALNRPLPGDFPPHFSLSPAEASQPSRQAAYNNFLIPFQGLSQAAAGMGVVTVDTDLDGVLRRSPMVFNYHDKLYPGLSIAPLLTDPDTPFHLHKDYLQVGSAGIPLNESGDYMVRMYGKMANYSASGLLASATALQAGDVESMLVDPAEFEGKYVFIGASAVGLHDLKTIALGENIPGVNFHASILGNVLEQHFLQPVSQANTYFATLALILLTVASILQSRNSWVQLVLPLGWGAVYLGWGIWQYSQDRLVALTTPLTGLALAVLVSYGLLLVTEGREKAKIRRMFSQYVSPAALAVIVDQYEDYAKAGSGGKQEVSILFSDIRGFTPLSESLSPEKLVELLNHYFAVMTKAIHAHHGTIDKFIGDAIMAVWGAPIPSNSHADDAVISAMEMITRLDEVNAWLAEHQFAPIGIGIGINTGEVVMGSIGSEQKADYTVIGDNVNLASRLEGLTKAYGCPILFSESCFQALSHPIPCRLIDAVRVKGKQQPIRVYTPILMADGQIDLERAWEISRLSEAAFEAYVRQDWNTAMDYWRQLPQDTATQLMLSRCSAYQAEPPGADWDGVFTMMNK